MSLEKYSELTEDIDHIEMLLDEADRAAEESDIRYTHEEFVSRIMGIIHEDEI